MMRMSFEFSKNIENLLFYGWTSQTDGGLVGSFIVIMAFAIILEGSKLLNLHLKESIRQSSERPVTTSKRDQSENDLLRGTTRGDTHTNTISRISRPTTPISEASVPFKKRLAVHAVQALIHLLTMVIGYFLMLSVMTYNAWFLIATVLGSGLGYFLFGSSDGMVREAAKRDDMETVSEQTASEHTTATVIINEGTTMQVTHVGEDDDDP